jgi:hypothetical protein
MIKWEVIPLGNEVAGGGMKNELNHRMRNDQQSLQADNSTIQKLSKSTISTN